ncbi:MAG: hypothetical protein GC129_00785 [Proteobacteria bacterium]|nr:hypothetical protein [Pseudomonadota bacterium]
MEKIEGVLRAFVGEHEQRVVALCDLAAPEKVWEIRGAMPMLAASVLKLPLVMRAAEMMAEGTLDADEQVPMNAFEVAGWSNILAVLDRKSISVREVAGLSLAASDNSTASWLFERIGAEPVNALMARLGCGEGNVLTYSFNEAILNERRKQHSNTMTAQGALKLLHAVWTQPVYAQVKGWLYNCVRGPRLRGYFGGDVYNKTGSLSGVVNDVGVLTDGTRAVAVAVFTRGETDAPACAREIGLLAKGVWGAISHS